MIPTSRNGAEVLAIQLLCFSCYCAGRMWLKKNVFNYVMFIAWVLPRMKHSISYRVCFVLPREFVLCCQESSFNVAKRVCFILPREFVLDFDLCCQEIFIYVANRVCFMFLRVFVFCG
jgi:hypothetical protein